MSAPALVDNQGAARANNLLASTTLAVAAANAAEAALTGLGAYRQAMILLDVTAAATLVGDTLDVYVDTSPDGGTTWVNVVHFTQVLGNGGVKQFWATLDAANPGTAVIAVATDAAAGVVRPAIFCDELRVRHTVVGTGSFTFAVRGFFKR